MDYKLYALVVEAYKNALENGVEIDKWRDEIVALDMSVYDADIEPYPYEEVLKCVKHFRDVRVGA